MEFTLNGDQQAIASSCTLEKLIESLQLDGKFAVEINQHIIPRSQYTSTQIQSGDTIEIVQAIGGG